MADTTRMITFARGNLPGNPHGNSAESYAKTGEVLALTSEQRTANLIALLNTPDVPACDRPGLLDEVYKRLGITVTEYPVEDGAALNL